MIFAKRTVKRLESGAALLVNAALVMVPNAHGVPRRVRWEDFVGHAGVRPEENQPVVVRDTV